MLRRVCRRKIVNGAAPVDTSPTHEGAGVSSGATTSLSVVARRRWTERVADRPESREAQREGATRLRHEVPPGTLRVWEERHEDDAQTNARAPRRGGLGGGLERAERGRRRHGRERRRRDRRRRGAGRRGRSRQRWSCGGPGAGEPVPAGAALATPFPPRVLLEHAGR